MSYCRFSDGDVYMFPAGGGGIACCSCLLQIDAESDPEPFDSADKALEHLREHQRAGHLVPAYAIERLESEIAATAQTGSRSQAV